MLIVGALVDLVAEQALLPSAAYEARFHALPQVTPEALLAAPRHLELRQVQGKLGMGVVMALSLPGGDAAPEQFSIPFWSSRCGENGGFHVAALLAAAFRHVCWLLGPLAGPSC